jgi:hypothetical protein
MNPIQNNIIYICDCCDTTFNNVKSFEFHKKICIYKNIHNDLSIVIDKNKIKDIVNISNILLLYNSDKIYYPISKELLLKSALHRKVIDNDVNDIINSIIFIINDSNNNIYEYDKLISIVSNITNINVNIIQQINNIYIKCLSYITIY